MADVRKNSELDTARQVDIQCKPNWRIAILYLQVRLRVAKPGICSNH
jgi:hypothetical protein